jgi:hypothetical protein
MAAKGQPTRTPNAATATVALCCLLPESTRAAARVIAYIEKLLGSKLVLALKHPLLMQRMPRVYIPILAPYRRVTTATRVASVTADRNPRASLKVKNTCTCNSQYCIAPDTKKNSCKAQHPDQSSTALPY